MLARTDRLSADIEDLSQVIEQLLAPYEEQLAQAEAGARLGTARRPGLRRETGAGMTRFRTGPRGGRAHPDPRRRSGRLMSSSSLS